MVDNRVYVEHDQHRFLVSGEPFLQFFSANGIGAVCDLLAAWAALDRAFVYAVTCNWSSKIANATVFCTKHFLGNRICMEFSYKIFRDNFCRKLSVSSLRQTNWSDARVTAQLTWLEQAN